MPTRKCWSAVGITKFWFLMVSVKLAVGNEKTKVIEDIYFFKNDEMVDFEKIMSCVTCNDPKSMPCYTKRFRMKIDMFGIYSCDGQLFFIFLIDKEFTFKWSRTTFIFGDKARFDCSVTPVTWNSFINSELTIHDTSFSYVIETKDEVHSKSLDQLLIPAFLLETLGPIQFYCNWTYHVTYFKSHYFRKSLIQSVNITVYGPPMNVQPDFDEVFLGENVTCSSEAYPDADHFWQCKDGKWGSRGPSLFFLELGEYFCICTAKNQINGSVFLNRWRGSIFVVGMRKKSDAIVHRKFYLLVVLAVFIGNFPIL